MNLIWEDLKRCHKYLEFEETNNGYVFKNLSSDLEGREHSVHFVEREIRREIG